MLVAAMVLLATQSAFGQKLPQSSRDVFKCTENGKVIYSDAPCLGAAKLNVEPTRGLDSASGKTNIGADVRRERMEESTAEALKPIFGETAQQRATRHRRFKLPEPVKKECHQLDAEIPTLERKESQVKEAELAALQKTLFASRQKYRSLGC